ncbi:helix-turn-helix domain-containing protein [Catellatospora coxensis]|uniref:Helix-turn-helix domain-containing protein n=1 Tax=Catellatospora coxensis TaxID=310354 RepID=A0A8J3L3T2_9ACTN|nr:helix-turn-helix domain-containing protein [Catellatospora coxensis]GIG11557.1 hypothetical protein Cco03nite_82570 [Catellatospora coxensis]
MATPAATTRDHDRHHEEHHIGTVVALRPQSPGSLARRRPERAVYAVREVAELLDLSLTSTYQLLRLGEIPAKQLGSRWVIPKQAFHNWLNDTYSTTDNEE